LQERLQRERFQKKLALADLRLKKLNQVQVANDRQRKIIVDKTKELERLREEIEGIRDKARERDHVNNKNKELVTKYYGQTSAMGEKDKRIQELKDKNEKLQQALREVQRSGSTKNNANVRTVTPMRVESTSSMPKKVTSKIAATSIIQQ
jgi:hypothetical protein